VGGSHSNHDRPLYAFPGECLANIRLSVMLARHDSVPRVAGRRTFEPLGILEGLIPDSVMPARDDYRRPRLAVRRFASCGFSSAFRLQSLFRPGRSSFHPPLRRIADC
jgi:hypothetical protein